MKVSWKRNSREWGMKKKFRFLGRHSYYIRLTRRHIWHENEKNMKQNLFFVFMTATSISMKIGQLYINLWENTFTCRNYSSKKSFPKQLPAFFESFRFNDSFCSHFDSRILISSALKQQHDWVSSHFIFYLFSVWKHSMKIRAIDVTIWGR